MAKNKTKGYISLRTKIIIASAASVAAAIGIIIGVTAYNTSKENRIAALRYEFERIYPNSFNSEVNLDPKLDEDGDGLDNETEKLMNTNAGSADTDGDGIPDGLEKTYGTDPLNADTDGDGISDGLEVLARLDPLSGSTNGTPDAERTFTYTVKFDEGTVRFSGGAEIFSASVEKLSLFTVSSNAGAYTFPYEIHCEKFESADIRFSYSSGLLRASGFTPEQIHIYKFDPRSKSYSGCGGSAVEGKNEVYGQITESGVYLLGGRYLESGAAVDENTQINVYMLIDNSGSMYPTVRGYTSEENDVEFKRCVFATNMVTKLGTGVKTAVSSFTYGVREHCGFISDKPETVMAINKIRSIGPEYDGTSVELALMTALGSFSESMKNERNVIIMLTDGISTDTAGYTLEDIVYSAQAKNVMIMTISLGNNIDKVLLQNIADHTGGKYFPISDANALEGLYSTLIATMEYDMVDEDMDGTPDSYALYETGFRPDENGFMFYNFKSTQSNTMDFGMLMLARDWFTRSIRTSAKNDEAGLAYDFEKTTINIKEPLSKVILTSMGASWLSPGGYLDFNSGSSALSVRKDAAAEAAELGWISRTDKLPDNSAGWTNVQYLVPNYKMDKIREKYGENDCQMLRAIGYYQTFRDNGKSFRLADETGLERIKKLLGLGKPVLMNMTWEDSGAYYSRYVLLTALRRDLDDPNSFNMKIYDVNSNPVDTVVLRRTLKLEDNGRFDGNYTYAASWNGRSVSLSFDIVEAK